MKMSPNRSESLTQKRNGLFCARRRQVLNGDGDGPPLGRGRYCGNAVVDVPDSSGGDVTIRYRCRGGRGRFALRYDTHVESCGGHVTLPPHLDDVFVTSPLYPNSTPENVECVWVVRSTDRRPMQINLVGSERLAQDTRWVWVLGFSLLLLFIYFFIIIIFF